MSNRIIRLKPRYTDIIKLSPINRTIWLGKGQGTYLELRKITVSDIKLQSHIKTLSGIYDSEVEFNITGIRARVHYPYAPGDGWLLNDNNYRLSQQATKANSTSSGLYFTSKTYCYGQVTYQNKQGGGTLFVPCRNGTDFTSEINVSMISLLRDDLFFGGIDGIKSIEGNDITYHSMFYNYKTPYYPTYGQSGFYKDDYFHGDSEGTPATWINGTINQNDKTWSIPNFTMGRYRYFTGDYTTNYGSFSECGQDSYQTNYVDPRLQFTEIQLLAEDGKIASRIYNICHIPQSIPSIIGTPHANREIEGKIKLFHDNPGYIPDSPPIEGNPAYLLKEDKISIGVSSGDAIFSKVVYPIHKISYGNKLPLPFPLTGSYFSENITETFNNITNKVVLKTWAKEDTLTVSDNDGNWEKVDSNPEGRQYVCNYKYYKPDNDNIFASCLEFDNTANKSFSVTYTTDYFSIEEIISVKSAKSNGSTNSLILADNTESYFSNITEYSKSQIRGFSKYCLECELWSNTQTETNPYLSSYLLFWVQFNLSNSQYLPCGSSHTIYTALSPASYNTRDFVKNYIKRDYTATYSYTYQQEGWQTGFYNSLYEVTSSLYNAHGFGRSSSTKENQWLYGNYESMTSININQSPITIPPLMDGYFLFDREMWLCSGLMCGVHGLTNDGGRSDSFVNIVLKGVSNSPASGQIYDPENPATNPSNFERFNFISLPLISTPATGVYGFAQSSPTSPYVPFFYNLLAPTSPEETTVPTSITDRILNSAVYVNNTYNSFNNNKGVGIVTTSIEPEVNI